MSIETLELFKNHESTVRFFYMSRNIFISIHFIHSVVDQTFKLALVWFFGGKIDDEFLFRNFHTSNSPDTIKIDLDKVFVNRCR